MDPVRPHPDWPLVVADGLGNRHDRILFAAIVRLLFQNVP
ncbi:hypothetical protein FRUB_04585 [Fimbriiglobus ruber]|uniref:Uncharacterized protein n=1 Tax=Fimbriiglobus ruber TaxID=1908690 RepID=A0A225DIE8_9BACT|nr:hypothetical protein FRUB_04585 [Fimbriiglobus ruber]